MGRGEAGDSSAEPLQTPVAPAKRGDRSESVMMAGWMVWLGLLGQVEVATPQNGLRYLPLPRAVRVDEFRQIQVAVTDHQWGEASDRWMALLKKAEPDWVVEEAGGAAIGFRAYVLKQIREWPDEGRRVFQESVTEEVERVIRLAKQSERPNEVAKALEQFPGSGLEATAGWMVAIASWDEGGALPRPASREGGGADPPFRLPAPVVPPSAPASSRYQSLGVISLYGQAQAAMGERPCVVHLGDLVAVADQRGRVRVYDPSGLVTQEILPPSSGGAVNPFQPLPWFLGSSPNGTAYIAYVTDGVAMPPSMPWIRRRPMTEDRATMVALRAVGEHDSDRVLGAFEVELHFSPAAILVRDEAVWIAGYKQTIGSWTPMVAKCSLITGLVEWETSLGGMMPGRSVSANLDDVAMALSPDGRRLAVMVAGDFLGLFRAETGIVEWVKPMVEKLSPPLAGGFPVRSWVEMTDDAVVCFAASDRVLAAVDLAGNRVRWTYRPEEPDRGVSLIGAREGLLVVRSLKGVRGLDLTSGKTVWQDGWAADTDPHQRGLWVGRTVVGVSDDQVIQWNGLTGERLQAWKRPSLARCILQPTDHLLYIVTASKIEAFVDDRYVQQLAGSPGRTNELGEKRVLALVAWAKGDQALALSLAMEVVEGTTGTANRFAQRQLAQWCRAAARQGRGAAPRLSDDGREVSSPQPALDDAIHMLQRSIGVLSGSERALLQWELASIFESSEKLEEAKAVYRALMEDRSAESLVEVSPGTQLNVRLVAALRYERLIAATLAAGGAAETGEFTPAWNVALAGSRQMRVSAGETVVAVMQDGGGVKGYAKKDGALLWEWKHDEEGWMTPGRHRGMTQVIEMPGGGVVQVQGQAAFELRVDINGVTQVMSTSSLGPQGGNLIAAGKSIVAVSPYGLVGLDPDTGATKWRQRFEKSAGQVPQIMATAEALVVGWQEGMDMVLMAFHAVTGDLLWKTKEGMPWGGLSLWTPYAFRPNRPVLANAVPVGPHLVYESGTNLVVRELGSGKKIWEKGMNRGASLVPDRNETEGVVWADPWTAWTQTSQCLPIRVEKGEPLASIPLPAQSRLIGLTKTCMILLKADTQELVAMRRDDQRVEWRCAVARSVLMDGLFWYDGEYLSVLSNQSVKVIHCEDGKEVLSAPLKRGAQIAGVWVQANVVAIATTTDLRLYTLTRPSN